MTLVASRDVLLRLRKLASLPAEIRQSQLAISITRLTVLKTLCQKHELADRFAVYLARKTLENMAQAKSRSVHAATTTEVSHRAMIEEALDGMERLQQTPTAKLRQSLNELHWRMKAEQNEHQDVLFGAVRLISDSSLLLVEYALSCVLAPDEEVGIWAYQTARHYAERYDSRYGTGLIRSSIPLLQDIIDFLMTEYSLTSESLAATPKAAKTSDISAAKRAGVKANAKFTVRQGQFLAFIHLYWKLHRQGPAEAELVQFFRITPPSVHSMVVKLEELGLVTRKPGVARSVRVAIPAKSLPELEDIDGPPW